MEVRFLIGRVTSSQITYFEVVRILSKECSCKVKLVLYYIIQYEFVHTKFVII